MDSNDFIHNMKTCNGKKGPQVRILFYFSLCLLNTNYIQFTTVQQHHSKKTVTVGAASELVQCWQIQVQCDKNTSQSRSSSWTYNKLTIHKKKKKELISYAMCLAQWPSLTHILNCLCSKLLNFLLQEMQQAALLYSTSPALSMCLLDSPCF